MRLLEHAVEGDTRSPRLVRQEQDSTGYRHQTGAPVLFENPNEIAGGASERHHFYLGIGQRLEPAAARPDPGESRVVARLLPGVTPNDLRRELDGLIVEFPERSPTDFVARVVGELT